MFFSHKEGVIFLTRCFIMADAIPEILGANKDFAGAAALSVNADREAIKAKRALIAQIKATIERFEDWLDEHPKALKEAKHHFEEKIAKLRLLLRNEGKALRMLEKEVTLDFVALQMSQMS